MKQQSPDQVPPGMIAYAALALMVPCTIIALHALYVGWANILVVRW